MLMTTDAKWILTRISSLDGQISQRYTSRPSLSSPALPQTHTHTQVSSQPFHRSTWLKVPEFICLLRFAVIYKLDTKTNALHRRNSHKFSNVQYTDKLKHILLVDYCLFLSRQSSNISRQTDGTARVLLLKVGCPSWCSNDSIESSE